MDFEKEQIFENNEINRICDLIFSKVNAVFNRTTDIIICGSVAKILSGALPEDYQAKDLDFVVRDYIVWRLLAENLQKWFERFKIEIINLKRVILYTETIAIEFWAGNHDFRETKKITENINYINYENTI